MHEIAVSPDRANPYSELRPMPIPIPILCPQLPSVDRLLPYLRRIDSTRTYSNHGPLVGELERRLAEHLRLPLGGVVSAASGTAALVGAILATAGRARPERPFAVVPAFTFVATASAVEQCGYRPYLADVDAESWMLDPDRLAVRPERDRIGIVVPVAPFGRPVPQLPWREFRERTGIPVAIDGAASFEALSDAPDRCLGDIPVALSFHATKSFATGEGGGVAATDTELARRVVQALNFGFYGSRDSRTPSINGKMSEYHAAVGLAELDGWPEKRASLQAVADCYRRLMAEAGLGERCIVAPDIASCYALFRCADRGESARVQNSLRQGGIDFRLWYGEGLHRESYLVDMVCDQTDATEVLAPCLLGLPVAPDFSRDAIARIVRSFTAA